MYFLNKTHFLSNNFSACSTNTEVKKVTNLTVGPVSAI